MWGCAGPAPASPPGGWWDTQCVGLEGTGRDWEPKFHPISAEPYAPGAGTGEGKDTTVIPRSRLGDPALPPLPGLYPWIAAGSRSSSVPAASPIILGELGGTKPLRPAHASAGRVVWWLFWLKQSDPRTKRESLLVCEAESGPAPALLPGTLAPQPGPLIGNRSPR